MTQNNPNLFDCHPLFEDVQMNQIFEDGKTFVDCIPKESTGIILQQYLQQKDNPGFSLNNFVFSYFELPPVFAGNYHTGAGTTADDHINELWSVLTRQPDEKQGSLIPLPNSYIVPGGRFGEVYYWDSYFTMLGLKAAGMRGMIENMVDNFSHLINTIGYIPNGNRTYYLGRSQPPFYSLMVQMLAEIKGKEILPHYLKPLEMEYLFWMKGAGELNEKNNTAHHAVSMTDGEVLNRYWDDNDTARPESYREDVALSNHTTQSPQILFRHLRAGAESGWDYSSRWFKDGATFETICTADIVPVDLNCLLYHLEHTIAEACHISENGGAARAYTLLAEKRKAAIQKYCWSDELRFYVDYDLSEKNQTREITLAGVAPMYLKIATQQQADLVAEILQAQFLSPGGVVTTLKQTGQQWDTPNGWAPLQWMTVIGLGQYSHHALAETIAQRWIKLNTDVYNRTGKFMEKYNVVDTHLEAGGGEYTGQDGFGWTNGVYLALKQLYGG